MLILLALLAQVTMPFSSPQQTIDGVGAATSIGGANGSTNGGAWSDANLDLMYTTLGFTIARIGIGAGVDEYTGSTGSWRDDSAGMQNIMVDCLRILKRQPNAKIFASPWSANIACKSNSALASGNFVTSCNTSWSTFISNSIDIAKNSGCPLYAVSLQNEPDFGAAPEGMTMTGAQITTWCDVLGPLVNAKGVLLMGPETSQWNNLSSYVTTMTADTTCNGFIGLWATHAYGTPFGTVAAPPTLGARNLWMSEASWFDNASNLLMTGTGGGLATAVVIMNAFNTGKVSAWISWWGISGNASQDDGLIEFGVNVSKRLYVVGNWSRFVRPGMVQFTTTGTPPTNVSLAAYKDPTSNNIAAVVLNNQASTQSFTLTLDATSKCKVFTAWITDSSNNLVGQTPQPVVAGVMSVTLTASSVTTLTCNGT